MQPSSESASARPTLAQGRLCIVLAALMWSTSGAFTKALTQETPLQLNTPAVAPLQIAFFRVIFAGLALLPLLRKEDISFRPLMLPMAGCFAVMNATFVLAMAAGTAANAIFLQYTAPMWMFLACVWWLGEPCDRRGLVALAIGLVGLLAIVAGGWQEDHLDIVGLGLGSGLAYAGVVIFLRLLKDESSRWLIVLNLLCSGLVLLPWVCLPLPSPGQLALLIVYGAGQMSVPYWLMARGVRTISPQEAGIITLIEPLLNPVWTYLMSREEPSWFTVAGGGCILAALAWRYWPVGRSPNQT